MSWPETLALGGTRRARHVPGRGRAAVPRTLHSAPAYPRASPSCSWRASGAILAGEERLQNRLLSADHRPPPAPGDGVPSRVPRGIRL